ncbi:MAG: FAD/NAD(P)-binding protein [Anaerolineales bacterium]|nr:FAD/NAD(P)-binding protein [Anaerolineales bacterium]
MSALLADTLNAVSIYLPVQARILDIRPLTKMDKLFTVELPDGLSLAHRPGQFVEVSVFGVGEAPISISSSPRRSDGAFELSIRKVGDLTGVLHSLQPGDTIGIRGPFGHGFPIERFRGKDILFAPVGLGLAPLRSLIHQVLEERSSFGRVTILYGAPNPSELLFADELQEWGERSDVDLHVTVDRAAENWKGNVGVITTLFPKIDVYAPNTVAITCGPPAMYRFVLMELLGLGIQEGNIWLNLERRMRCGVGKCGHCQINHIYTCQDGPCFSYAQIKHLEEAL